jgi:hypothetical protein
MSIDLFKGTINDAQADVGKDITQAETGESVVITGAIVQFEAMLNRLLQGYTLEIKAVKK